jgi:thiol-disulfide isomerase/thioredoxin
MQEVSMSRLILLVVLTVALSGCGDSNKSVPVADNNSSGSAAKRTPADRLAPANGEVTVQQPKSGAGEAEDMPENAPQKNVAADDNDENSTAKEDQPANGETAGNDAAKEGDQPEKVTLDSAFQAAAKAMQKGDMAGALAELEKALPDNPNEGRLLLNLALLNQQAGSTDRENPDYEAYKKSGDYYRRAMKADPNFAKVPNIAGFAPTIYYNEACAVAKAGKPANALKPLQEAIEAGFKSLVQIEKDDDLAAVRELPEFPEFLEKARAAAFDRIFSETKPFDFNFELTDIEGNAIAKSDLNGKVAIVDVWGTWCPPCRMEIPHFVELQSKYKDAGLEIVGLNSERVKDADEALQLVKDFHKENGMNYRCALINQELLNQIPDFQGFPTTLFLDRTGKVRAKTVGYEDLATLDGIVSRLLAEKAEGDNPAADQKPASEDKSETETKPDDAGQ